MTTFSPLEAAICFQVYGTQRYTIINRESFSQSAMSLPMSLQILTRDDGSLGMVSSATLTAPMSVVSCRTMLVAKQPKQNFCAGITQRPPSPS